MQTVPSCISIKVLQFSVYSSINKDVSMEFWEWYGNRSLRYASCKVMFQSRNILNHKNFLNIILSHRVSLKYFYIEAQHNNCDFELYSKAVISDEQRFKMYY